MGTLTSIARQVRRKLAMARAAEHERIAYHERVIRGEDVKLTGEVDFGSEPFLVRLGSHITIADGVRFITHDGAARLFRTEFPNLHVYAPIEVGDNVFIGVEAIIMPGVRIGDDSVIGAGSVVTKDVPSGEVWGGAPARFIKTTADYKAGVMKKGIDWPAGQYDDEWQRHLEEQFLSE